VVAGGLRRSGQAVALEQKLQDACWYGSVYIGAHAEPCGLTEERKPSWLCDILEACRPTASERAQAAGVSTCTYRELADTAKADESAFLHWTSASRSWLRADLAAPFLRLTWRGAVPGPARMHQGGKGSRSVTPCNARLHRQYTAQTCLLEDWLADWLEGWLEDWLPWTWPCAGTDPLHVCEETAVPAAPALRHPAWTPGPPIQKAMQHKNMSQAHGLRQGPGCWSAGLGWSAAPGPGWLAQWPADTRTERREQAARNMARPVASMASHGKSGTTSAWQRLQQHAWPLLQPPMPQGRRLQNRQMPRASTGADMAPAHSSHHGYIPQASKQSHVAARKH
jgi:hypothetical protein